MAVRSRVRVPPKPPTRRKAPTASRTQRAHIRRVTLNLVRHAACCPRPLKRVINRLAKIDWDMDALTAKELDTVYAHVDDDLAERAKAEFTADTASIVDHRGNDWTCSLCGHQGCRWEFTLENVAGGTSVKTGSHCIIEYALSVDGEISAEEALKRLRAAISRMKRAEEREKWQEANPCHVADMAMLKDAYEYVRRPINVRSLWSYLKAGWNRRVGPWQKKAKATLKYYNREGFLTQKRTDDLVKLVSSGTVYYNERRHAEDIVDSFCYYWDALLIHWATSASTHELNSLRYARRWKMDPDYPVWQVADTVRVLVNRTGSNPARDDDGNAIISAPGAKATKSKATEAPAKPSRSARRKRRGKTTSAPRKSSPTPAKPVDDGMLF
jgi:hypothetical protein